MKNKILTGIVLGIITSFVIACNPKKEEVATEPGADTEKIKSEIQAIENEFAEAYNNKTLATCTYYADDATSYFQGRPPLVGKDAIHKSLDEASANFRKGDKMSFTTNEVFAGANGKKVLEIGSYEVVDSTNTTIDKGNYMSLFEKRDGKWVCIRDMGTTEMSNTEK